MVSLFSITLGCFTFVHVNFRTLTIFKPSAQLSICSCLPFGIELTPLGIIVLSNRTIPTPMSGCHEGFSDLCTNFFLRKNDKLMQVWFSLLLLQQQEQISSIFAFGWQA